MENPLSLRLIKEEQESSEKLLELLVSSTHSPKGRFSKENSYIMLKRKIETTKNGNTVKLVLPFPHFLCKKSHRFRRFSQISYHR